VVQEVIPHDGTNVGLLTPDGKSVRNYASTSPAGQQADGDVPLYTLSPAEIPTLDWDCLLIRDHSVLSPNVMRLHLVPYADHPPHLDIHLDDFWMSAYAYLKVRSQLRVPLKLHGRVIGGMAFTSSQPDLYSEDDVEFARRVADHLALAMAHSELAAEAARAADAQERAARLQDRVKVLVEELETKSSHRAIGRSKRWRDVLAHATKVAPTDTTVLITGESGTGKEVVARFIHRASKRAEGPFVALNCAALPEHLLESELFGHEKGAFTGAVAARAGRVEQAGGGVLFLDEVGEMSPSVQAKLLRVLQEREFQRLGGTRTQKADVRVLAATNRDLRASIATGGFREDLYYRLGVFEIPLPPLRERTDDILVLVEAFLTEIGASFGRPAAGLSEDAQQRLLAHAWPGNVRELRNAIERAMILCEGGLITSEHLPLAMTGPLAAPASAASSAPPSADGAPPWTFPAAGVDLEKIERDLVLKALAEAGNNRSKAAKLLGLNRGQLYSRLEKHGLR
jgi:transcriptional regulator with GAF, ATPase, and Fis domain